MIWFFSIFVVAVALVGVANKVFSIAVEANLLKAEHDNSIEVVLVNVNRRSGLKVRFSWSK